MDGMKTLWTLAFALPLLTACGAPTPCTTCPTVSGTYFLESEPLDVDGTDCEYEQFSLYYTGSSGTAILRQTDSAITLDFGGFYWEGTLFEKDMFSFDPVEFESTAAGTVDLAFSGTFYGAEGTRKASGSFNFSLRDAACFVQSSVVMTQTGTI